MERWIGRVALVTGASAGIGKAISNVLVKNGMKVVGCARNIEQIQALSDELKNESGSLKAIKCDLRNEHEILEMFKQIKGDYGGIDVLINNAGLSQDAPLLSGETEKWREMLEVNVLAPCICSREAFKLMKQNKVDDGQIITLNSMSGHRVLSNAGNHFYCATKHAVKGLNEGLRNEMRALKTHIRTCEISPGLVDTEFSERAFGEEKTKKIFSSLEPIHDVDVAEAVIYVLSSPAHVQVHDILMRPTEQVF